MKPSRFALAVRTLRDEHDWTQEQLAVRLDTTKYSVSKLELGSLPPNFATISRIARAFGMKEWELLRFADRLAETIDTRHDDEPQLRRENWRAA